MAAFTRPSTKVIQLPFSVDIFNFVVPMFRRCSSKSQKSGRWNAKDSPHKNKLDYVSSEDETNETESSQAASNNEQNVYVIG